jgi:multidrug efflux system outer membrane protein
VHRPIHPTLSALGAALLAVLLWTAPASAASAAGSLDFVDLYRQAVTFHESVGQAEERLEQAKYQRAKMVAALRPTLSVDASTTRRPKTLSSSSFGIQRPKETRNLTVAVVQSLYTGGRASNQIKIARIDEASSEVGVEVAKDDLVFSLAQAFFDVLKAQADLAAVTERREGMERHLKAAQARVRLGADVKASALRLESEVARLRAEEMGDAHALKSARENLSNLSGVPQDVELGLPPDMGAVLALKDPLQAALDQRADIHLLRGEAAAARFGVRYTTGTFLPFVKIEGDYQRHGEDPSSGFLIDEESFALLTATWDLYNGGEDLAERRRTKAVYREKELALRQLKRDVGTEVEQAAREVRVASQIVDSLEDALRYATENHRIVPETYKAGAATYLDVIDASTALGDAQRDLENARHDHSLALLRLAKATGRLPTLVDAPLPSYGKLQKWVKKAE